MLTTTGQVILAAILVIGVVVLVWML